MLPEHLCTIMPIIVAEEKEEYKRIVRRIMTMNPTITIYELVRRLKEAEKPIDLSRQYVTQLVREVRLERIKEIEDESKEDIYAKMMDAVAFVNNQLRAIAQEEKLVYSEVGPNGEPLASPKMRIFAQNNRIKALNSVVDNLLKLANLKMDLGIVERKVGTMDFQIIDVMSALKKIRNGDYKTPLAELTGGHDEQITAGGNDGEGSEN